MKVNRIVSILMLAGLILASFSSFAQSKTLKTESDGFQWYQLEQNGKFGAQSMGGTTFIPLSRGYTFICYHQTEGGWFSVEKNGSKGACDILVHFRFGSNACPAKALEIAMFVLEQDVVPLEEVASFVTELVNVHIAKDKAVIMR